MEQVDTGGAVELTPEEAARADEWLQIMSRSTIYTNAASAFNFRDAVQKAMGQPYSVVRGDRPILWVCTAETAERLVQIAQGYSIVEE